MRTTHFFKKTDGTIEPAIKRDCICQGHTEPHWLYLFNRERDLLTRQAEAVQVGSIMTGGETIDLTPAEIAEGWDDYRRRLAAALAFRKIERVLLAGEVRAIAGG